MDHPRLAKDSFFARLFGFGNLVAGRQLKVQGVENIVIHSLIHDSLGLKPHYSIHARRMGTVVGKLLADGPTPELIDNLRRMVQPADADRGEPIPQAEYDATVRQYEKGRCFDHAGRLLSAASIVVRPASSDAAGKFGGSLPDLFLHVVGSDKKTEFGRTEIAFDTMVAGWQPGVFGRTTLNSRFKSATQRRLASDRWVDVPCTPMVPNENQNMLGCRRGIPAAAAKIRIP